MHWPCAACRRRWWPGLVQFLLPGRAGGAGMWDLETLRPLHTLRQPAGNGVLSLGGKRGRRRGGEGQVVVG